MAAPRSASRAGHRLAEEAFALSGHIEFLLPSLVSVKRVISENTPNAALRRMAYRRSQFFTGIFEDIRHFDVDGTSSLHGKGRVGRFQ